MVKKSNRFIDPSRSVRFQVVHRSQRDPRTADETAPKLVLRAIPLSGNLVRKQQNSDGCVPASHGIDASILGDAVDVFDEDGVPVDALDDDDDDEYDDLDDDSDDDSQTEFPKQLRKTDRTDANQPKLRAYDGFTRSKDDQQDAKDVSMYGIFFNDQESYDYLQHLKPMGDDPGAVFISAPSVVEAAARSHGKTGGIAFRDQDARESMSGSSATNAPSASTVSVQMGDGISIPVDVLPSEIEESVGYLNRVAVTHSAGEFDPNIDPDLLETLQALDDDEFVDDDGLDDDFVGALNAETVSDEVVQRFASDRQDQDDHDDDEHGWMKEFSKFKKQEQRRQIVRDEDGSTVASDDTDATPKAAIPAASATKKAKSRGARTATTSFSMSSSSLFRNDKLTLLDDRFEKLLTEYEDDKIGDLDPEDPDTCGNVAAIVATASGLSLDDEADPEMAQKLDDMFDSFLASTQLVGQGKVIIPARQNLDVFRDALRDDAREAIARIKAAEAAAESSGSAAHRRSHDQDQDDTEIVMPQEKQYDTWDVESVLTTYSNIYNHPTLIREVSRNAPQIKLKGKHGIPRVIQPKHDQLDDDGSEQDSDSNDDCESCVSESQIKKGVARDRNESKEAKRERKAQAKAERRERRATKKSTKMAFRTEQSRQLKLVDNQKQQERAISLQ